MINFSGTIYIVGHAKTGKTTLANSLWADGDTVVWSTDDWVLSPFVPQHRQAALVRDRVSDAYYRTRDVRGSGPRCVFEGVALTWALAEYPEMKGRVVLGPYRAPVAARGPGRAAYNKTVDALVAIRSTRDVHGVPL